MANVSQIFCSFIDCSLEQVFQKNQRISLIVPNQNTKEKKNMANIDLYPDTGDQCSQLIVATLVPSTPICLFFNLAKLQCKQTVVTYFCIGFVNKIHSIGKGMIKETWIAKIKEIACWTEELITFCPFSPVSAWSKKASKFCGQACRLELRLWAWRSMHGWMHKRKQWGRAWHKTIFLILANWTRGVPHVNHYHGDEM